MPRSSLTRLRKICLALPEAVEQETWGEITFRVRGKIFVIAGADGSRFTCKAPHGIQSVLVGADPERFRVPPYVGHRGWVGVSLHGKPDWAELAAIVKRSYLMTAPKRVARRVGAE